ncbi:hypothetical protein [Paenibacillus hamazuiensis]|uniref:hypothetical protein n=1 Tax=Paenibacillus hamazuiensis TaxID=2936508 RepID=UPI00200E7A4A|nr:hypothetical protein [Paenibacillus hamazuiensis]
MRKNLILSNQSSFFINLLLYIYGLYHNKSDNKRVFPFYKYTGDGFLTYEQFRKQLHRLWEHKLIELDHSAISFVQWDVSQVQDKTIYSQLFEDSENGICALNDIWDSFYSWWWNQPFGGKSILDGLTDEMISPLFEKITKKLDRVGVVLHKPIHFAVQLTINPIPDDLNVFYNRFVVVPINNFKMEKEIDHIGDMIVRSLVKIQ